ncbi:MAG: arsenate reductase ArsC [Thermoanaerobaculia bacterium]|nr:arsenate reductase ArsC [Thermoanaerobaculia bacterium]
MSKRRVLILCTGNSCRSQMGEGWVRYVLGDRVEVHSAGTKPSFVHPRAIQVMGEAGVDLSSHTSKGVESLKGISFDLVVTVCDSAREACPVFPGARKTVHRAFEDPAHAGEGDDALPVFRRVRDEIRDVLPPLVSRELGLSGD